MGTLNLFTSDMRGGVLTLVVLSCFVLSCNGYRDGTQGCQRGMNSRDPFPNVAGCPFKDDFEIAKFLGGRKYVSAFKRDCGKRGWYVSFKKCAHIKCAVGCTRYD